MAVDVKVIGVYLWRFSVLFAGLCFRFGKKHPCISGTLLSFLFLYVFFPLVFRLLIYSSPVIFCAYAYRKNSTKPEHPEARIQKKYNQANDLENELDEEEKHKELKGAEYDSKKTKEIEKVVNAETEDGNWSKHNEESECDILDKAEYEDEEETQEEDTQDDDTRKAVEWTEQDEKNLMELGTSETERDKRLESLIQKRRARKLLSMQVRNVIDIIRRTPNQVAPLVIATSTGPLNLINTLSDTDDLHMPGSAPSVLLPSRSPFDLPYDPFEERPVLTGDSSFEQEFVTADQKDFCRHESFFYGGHSGTRQDGNCLNSFINAENTRTERQRFSRFRSYIDRGSYESISPGTSSVEHELVSCGNNVVQEPGCPHESSNQPVTSKDNTEPVNTKTEGKEQFDSQSQYCQGHVTEGNLEPEAEGLNADSNRNLSSEDLTNFLHKSLASSIQETSAKGAKENARVQAPLYTSSKDLFNVHKRILHTPAHSIASDLVVEVSEAGSPPTLSPPDEDSSHYDGDIDRDLSSGSEDLSLHVYKMEEDVTRSVEGQESIHEVVELEEEVVDEYQRTSSSSSDDDNSSYENVVHHLTEKLNARRMNNNVVMGTSEEPCDTAEMGSGVQIENLISNQTNPMSVATEQNSTTTDQHETFEPDVDSSKQVNITTEEEGSSNIQVTGNVRGSTEVSSSSDVTMMTEPERQGQAHEVVTEITSPNSVLPDTDFRDQITRIDSQPSDLADNVSDVTQLENSTSPDNQSSNHMEIPNARSSLSESSSQHVNNNEGFDQVTEPEAALDLYPSITEDNTDSSVTSNMELTKDAHRTVSSNNQDVSLEVLSSSEALPLSNTLNSDDEFNGMALERHEPDLNEGSSAPESSKQNMDNNSTTTVSNAQTPGEILDDTSNRDSNNEAPLPEMDTELHIHHITETCM